MLQLIQGDGHPYVRTLNLMANVGASVMASALLSVEKCPCEELADYLTLLAETMRMRGLLLSFTVEHEGDAPEQGSVH